MEKWPELIATTRAAGAKTDSSNSETNESNFTQTKPGGISNTIAKIGRSGVIRNSVWRHDALAKISNAAEYALPFRRATLVLVTTPFLLRGVPVKACEYNSHRLPQPTGISEGSFGSAFGIRGVR